MNIHELVVDWGKRTFPDLIVDFNQNARFYKPPTTAPMRFGPRWLVSVEQHKCKPGVWAWNFSGKQDYIVYISLTDPDLFVKLEAFINKAIFLADEK